jgi:hypothetical protein
MWQCKNQGPALSVKNRMVYKNMSFMPIIVHRVGAYDVIASRTGANDIAPRRIIKVVSRLPSGPHDLEVVLNK